jgi:hypothetical protein
MNHRFMETFPSSRVKKRFLTQVRPLVNLLHEYGFSARIVFEAIIEITRQRTGVVVMMKVDERRFNDDADIFVVCNIDKRCTGNIACKNIQQILCTLARWGVIGEDEIPRETFVQVVEMACIRCDACDRSQKAPCRFKQCKLCHDREKLEDRPEYNGFYCGKECQIAHWAVHKKVFHS